jgi:hypothetical protein
MKAIVINLCLLPTSVTFAFQSSFLKPPGQLEQNWVGMFIEWFSKVNGFL